MKQSVITQRTTVWAAALAVAALLVSGEFQAGRADVKVPALFTDHMVLQQGHANPVWGWAEPGEMVTVSIAGQSHQATAGADGRWRVRLTPLPVGGPHELKIAGKNTLTITRQPPEKPLTGKPPTVNPSKPRG